MGEERMKEALCDEGREFAKALSALMINDDEEALNEGDGDELQAHAMTLNYKDLKGIIRARKKKEARLGKAVGSGEEPPPKDLKEAMNHPTRGKAWHKSALDEFQGLTDMGVFDHDYSWEDLKALGIDVEGKCPPINISVALTIVFFNFLKKKFPY